MGHLSSNSRALFVTGTDTEVGKTLVSAGLLKLLNQKGYMTAGYKPVAAGCSQTEEGLRNDDALCLLSNSSLDLSYPEVNPVAFKEPIAPHLAAKMTSDNSDGAAQKISIDSLREGFIHLLQKKPDVLVVEGAGGWRLPLGEDFDGQPRYLSELAIERNLSVVLVVGIRLGCLNHAILTAECIRNDGLKIAGWVANQIDPAMPYIEENINSLKGALDAPFIGSIPRLEGQVDASSYLDLSALGL